MTKRGPAGRLRGVEACLAHGPAMTFIAIVRLLLVALAQAGVDEHLIRRGRCLADFILRRLDNDVTVTPVRVIDLVGVVVGYAA